MSYSQEGDIQLSPVDFARPDSALLSWHGWGGNNKTH